MTNHRTLIPAAVVILLGALTPSLAQTGVGAFRDWNAFIANEPDGKQCFIASQPQDSRYSQQISSRDPVFFMITSVPSKNVVNEASTIIGYAIAEDAQVTLEVDGRTFLMFSNATDTAWVRPEQEGDLLAAMKAGTRMTVQGKSRRGTVTTDIYSLLGVTAALDKMLAECPSTGL